MSVFVELDEEGQVRVRVDRGGERAVSDLIDPIELIQMVAEAAELDLNDVLADAEEDPEAEPTEPVEEEIEASEIDESAPPETEPETE